MKDKFISILLFLLLFSMTTSHLFAQKWGESLEYSPQCLSYLSQYQGLYKKQLYSEAYTPWNEALKICPCSNKNMYIRGFIILKSLLQKTNDTSLYNQYVDELLSLYDKRIICFPEEINEDKARKAIDLRTYKKESDVDTYYSLLEEALKSEEDLDPKYAYYFYLATLEFVSKHETDSVLLIDNYDFVSSIFEKALHSNPKSKEEIQFFQEEIDESFSSIINCDQFIKKFQSQYNSHSEDLEFLREIADILNKYNCTVNDLFSNAVQMLYLKNPDAHSSFLMGKLQYSLKQYDQAIQSLNESIEQSPAASDLYDAHYTLALMYSQLSDFSEARYHAYEATRQNAMKGEPYILIAQLYLQSIENLCEDVDKQTVYWIVVDMAMMAKKGSADPNIIEEADQLIQTYSALFPEKAEIAKAGLEEGNLYEIGCWIQRMTIIRSK